jgi:hypothetical protein
MSDPRKAASDISLLPDFSLGVSIQCPPTVPAGAGLAAGAPYPRPYRPPSWSPGGFFRRVERKGLQHNLSP